MKHAKNSKKKTTINTILQKLLPEIEEILGMYAEDNNVTIQRFITFHLKADFQTYLDIAEEETEKEEGYFQGTVLLPHGQRRNRKEKSEARDDKTILLIYIFFVMIGYFGK